MSDKHLACPTVSSADSRRACDYSRSGAPRDRYAGQNRIQTVYYRGPGAKLKPPGDGFRYRLPTQSEKRQIYLQPADDWTGALADARSRKVIYESEKNPLHLSTALYIPSDRNLARRCSRSNENPCCPKFHLDRRANEPGSRG